jgi:hypothetical protein
MNAPRPFAALALAIASSTALLWTATAGAAPTPVTVYYMTASTTSGLSSDAYTAGCRFARNHPGGNRLLLLDFGAARKVTSTTYGAIALVSNHLFSNADILTALQRGADGVHDCYVRGDTIVAYGNSNYHLSGAGLSQADAYNVGYYQSQRASQLDSYQASKNYNRQNAAIGSDMEPSWDGPAITRKIADGASAQGFAPLFDFGSADGCPWSGSGGSCNNGWTVADVAYVSWDAPACWPLPEIYYNNVSDPVNANQWTVVRRNSESRFGGTYYFYGVTGTPGVGLTPAQGWDALNARNPGRVLPELVNIVFSS